MQLRVVTRRAVLACQVDVLIVGAGVIGIATAYSLSKARPDFGILLLEGGSLGADTGRSASHMLLPDVQPVS